MKRLGVIGGIGPVATVYFYNSLINLCKRKLGSHFPHILINNVETWKFVETIGNKEKMVKFLRKEISSIEKESDLIVIVCNTAHSVIKELKKTTSVPILEIHKEVIAKIKRSRVKKVGILGTDLTIRSGLYTKGLERYGIDYEVLSPFYEYYLNKFSVDAIAKAMTPGKLRKVRANFFKYIDYLAGRGCDSILLGCTDYSFFVSKKDVKGLKLFSSTDILAEAVVDKLKEDFVEEQTQTI